MFMYVGLTPIAAQGDAEVGFVAKEMILWKSLCDGFCRPVAGAVVHDHDFVRRIIEGAYAVEAGQQFLPLVEVEDDNRDPRAGFGHGRAP